MSDEKIESTVGSEKEPIVIAVDIDPRMSHAQRVKQAQTTVRAFAKNIGIDHLPAGFFSNRGVMERECLNCKIPHNDPRGFCSSKCCKDYSVRKTAERKELVKNGENSRSRNRKKRR